MNPRIASTLPSSEETFSQEVTTLPSAEQSKSSPISHEPPKHFPWRNSSSNANNPQPSQRAYYCAHPREEIARHQISQLKKESEKASQNIELITSEGHLLRQEVLELHAQVQEKLENLSSSSEVKKWLEGAREALRGYNESDPDSDVATLYFREASYFYEAAIEPSPNSEKSKILIGLATFSHYIAEEYKKKELNIDIINSAFRGSDNFKEALKLLETSSKEESNKPEKTQKLKLAEYLYCAGKVLLQSIEEELKPHKESNKTAISYLATSCDYYEKAREEMASQLIAKAVYSFSAATAYEEAAKEELKGLPNSVEAESHSSTVKMFFLQSGLSFSMAWKIFGFDSNKAKNFAAIGKISSSLGKEYQKEKLDEERIHLLNEELNKFPEIKDLIKFQKMDKF